MGKLSQYRREFRNEWTDDALLKGWIVRVDEDDSIARCKFCGTVLPAHYAGLCNHARNSTHVRNMGSDSFIKQEPGCEQDCMLNLQVFPTTFQSGTQSVGETQKLQTADTMAFDSSSDAYAAESQQYQSVKDSSKRAYRHKFSAKWNNDPALKDWLRPMAGDVYQALCSWCDSILPAHLSQLKEHSKSEFHVQKGLAVMESNDQGHQDEISRSMSSLVEIGYKTVKKRSRLEFQGASSEQENDGSDDEHESQLRSSFADEDSNRQGQFYITASKGDCSGKNNRKRKIKQAGCYVLSRSQWDRYRQKYRQKWESDPLFQVYNCPACEGWLAPVEGDIYKARCLYCRMMFRAHSKDLKDHARTSKHATNVAFGMPCSSSEPSEPAPCRNTMWRKRALQSRKCSRFDRTVKSEPLAVVRQSCSDSYASAGLLEPDETLATHESLISIALNVPSGKPTSNITTLVMPDPTKSLDEFISSSLPQIDDDDAYQILRVMKVLPKKDSNSAASSGGVRDTEPDQAALSRYARTMTLWEFLKMKFDRRQSTSCNAASFLASMLSEVEMLQHHLRHTVKEQLAAIPNDTNHPQAASNILVIQSEEMAQFLGIETGKYFIRESDEQVMRQQQHQKSADNGSVSRRGRRSKLASSSINPVPNPNEVNFYETAQQSMIGLDQDVSSYMMGSQQVVQYENELVNGSTLDQIATDLNAIDCDSVSLKYGEPADENNQVVDCSETYVGQTSSDDALLVLYVTEAQEAQGCGLSPCTLQGDSSVTGSRLDSGSSAQNQCDTCVDDQIFLQ